MNTSILKDKVALVTGASRGVGKGIALGLQEAGATVYITGRTAPDQTWLPRNIIPLRCDHRHDDEVAAVFERIRAEQGRLDVLVNNVWGGYDRMIENGDYTWETPFWQQPRWRWDAMFEAGGRAHFVASQFTAPLMIEQGSGLIVNISSWAGRKYLANTIYGVAKAATDRMAADMALELEAYDVAVVALYPGLVRTEKVMQAAEYFDLGNSESPRFVGRAVAALAADPDVMDKSGEILYTAALAEEYGFTDIDGKCPRVMTLAEAF